MSGKDTKGGKKEEKEGYIPVLGDGVWSDELLKKMTKVVKAGLAEEGAKFDEQHRDTEQLLEGRKKATPDLGSPFAPRTNTVGKTKEKNVDTDMGGSDNGTAPVIGRSKGTGGTGRNEGGVRGGRF